MAPNFFFQRQNVGSVTPYLRQTSATLAPASTACSARATCSSAHFFRAIPSSWS
jgi:hypothetical protein